MNLYGIPIDSINKLNHIFSQYPSIEKVILYGSRAKGTPHKFSDIDITLVGDSITKSELSKLSFQIDDLLLPYMFDISIFNTISNPDVIAHITRVGKILYTPDCPYF